MVVSLLLDFISSDTTEAADEARVLSQLGYTRQQLSARLDS